MPWPIERFNNRVLPKIRAHLIFFFSVNLLVFSVFGQSRLYRLGVHMAAPSKPTEVPQAVLDLPYFVQSPTIAQCRAAIENASGFREVNKDDYVLFNYDFCFRGSFPDPRTAPTVEEALLRQTRR